MQKYKTVPSQRKKKWHSPNRNQRQFEQMTEKKQLINKIDMTKKHSDDQN